MTSRILPLLISGAVLAPGAAWAQPTAPAPAAAPPAATAPAASGYTPFAAPSPPVDIVDTLTAGGKFTTLLKLIDAAGLTATLKGAGNYTLFAPTDDAFAALPAGTVDTWLKPESRPALQKALLYHLINAPVLSTAVVGHAAAELPSGAGAALRVDGSGGAMKVNGATVVQADVKASDGTVQVIDKVLVLAS